MSSSVAHLPELHQITNHGVMNVGLKSVVISAGPDGPSREVTYAEVIEHGSISDVLLLALIMLQSDGVRQARQALEANTPERAMAAAMRIVQGMGIKLPGAPQE